MKKTLLWVFGGFVVVLGIFAFFSNLFTQELHENHVQLLRIDNAAQRLQNHKEKVLNLSKHSSQFDSIAMREHYFLRQSYEFYDSLFHFQITKNESKNQHWKRRVEFAMNSERHLLLKVSKLGFKEFGLLGDLRNSIHQEDAQHPELKTQILSLRRHEKDFIMRLDHKYAELFNNELNALRQAGMNHPLLTQYQNSFNQSKRTFEVLYQTDNGVFATCIREMENVQAIIRFERSDLLRKSSEISNSALDFQVITSVIFVLVLLIISFWLIQRYTSQVNKLRLAMDGFIRSNYETKSYFIERLPKNEIGLISMHFIQLARKIQEEVKYLEQNVSRRTETLKRKNEQLEKQHNEIVDSLHYAQNLQQALLVSNRRIGQQFKQAWVYYQPKNIVGGDFYWMKEYKRGNAEFVLFALADCTGHGVPGALISILGMNTLDELTSSGLCNPAALLNQLRIIIGNRFTSDTGQRMDGMDISIFQLNKRTGRLTFSGAHMPLWILRGRTTIELKGQRTPIGLTHGEAEDFKNQVIQLEEEDRILLFSDGFTDQFGGKFQKKWGKKGFREYLSKTTKTQTGSLFHQLVSEFERWKGDTEQTDDCSMILLEVQLQDEAISKTDSTRNLTSVIQDTVNYELLMVKSYEL